MEQTASAPISLRIGSIAQLFNTLDPSPFREADLAAEAEAFLIDWAEELRPEVTLAIDIHLPAAEAERPEAQALEEVVRQHFARLADSKTREIRRLLRDGRRALVIAIGILGLCLLVAWAVSGSLGEGPFASIFAESFVIIGWVALWRPGEMLLYDWLPLARRRALARRFAAARVTLRPG